MQTLNKLSNQTYNFKNTGQGRTKISGTQAFLGKDENRKQRYF